MSEEKVPYGQDELPMRSWPTDRSHGFDIMMENEALVLLREE